MILQCFPLLVYSVIVQVGQGWKGYTMANIRPYNYILTIKGIYCGETYESRTEWAFIESVNDYMKELADEVAYGDLVIDEVILEEL